LAKYTKMECLTTLKIIRENGAIILQRGIVFVYKESWPNKKLVFLFHSNFFRNPSIQEFVNCLQVQEKYWSNKCWETFRYSIKTKKNVTLKIKTQLLQKNVLQYSSTDFSGEIVEKFHQILKKFKTNETSLENKPIPAKILWI